MRIALAQFNPVVGDIAGNTRKILDLAHAAITHMEQQGMPQTIVDALKAAQRRSKELGS